MIQIPISLLTSFVISLDNKLIYCIESDDWKYSPLHACFITDNSSSDIPTSTSTSLSIPTYTLILIEIIGLRVITKPIKKVIIKSSTYTYSIHPHFSQGGKYITWSYGTKMSDGCYAWITKEIRIRDEVMYLIKLEKNKALSTYEKWLLDFMSIREAVMGVNNARFSFSIHHERYRNPLVSLDRVYQSIVESKEELENEALLQLSKYPLDSLHNNNNNY